RKRVLDAGRLDGSGSTGYQLGAVHRLFAQPPRIPLRPRGKREPHGQRWVGSAGEADLALEPQRIAARHRDAELDLAFHLPAVEVAQSRFDLEPAVATFEMRLDAHPIDRDRPHVFELD